MDVFDSFVLGIVVLLVLYYTKGKSLQGKSTDTTSTISEAGDSDTSSRSIARMLEESKKNCVVFYGSQTGTAEDYAKRLAKEGKSRFGLDTIVVDLEEYDYDDLESIPSSKILIFVLATHGEGEPTDNAVDFYGFLTGDDNNFSNGLQNINYVTFGLGNSTYEHYNSVARNVSRALDDFGAERIGVIGEGDDGTGSTEEDFLAWKDPMWTALAVKMGLEEQETSYEPTFSITPRRDLTETSANVFLGEPNLAHLKGIANKQSFSASNPYIASISQSNELFKGGDRNCLHIELALGDSGLSYNTGDHVAIWPTNPENEVESLLGVLGLSANKNTVIDIKALEKTSKVPIPTPTTYETVLRSYLEICAPVSRQFMASIATFSPDASIKSELAKIGSDKEYFQERISKSKLTVAQVLRSIGGGAPWTSLPFSALVEGLNKLQPRYYSISSSSLVQPRSISISAVVESYEVAGRPTPLKGVATNYLLALKQKQNGEPISQAAPTYDINGPRGKYQQIQVPIHVRQSSFRLPSDAQAPVILIGPGTGVAPFRAFVQERVHLAKQGKSVGQTLLFFGCRHPDQDFIYESEWQEYKEVLGDRFDMMVAFSRQGPKKVYVQNLLKTHSKVVHELLKANGHIYVCGDAKYMARDVQASFVEILRDERGIEESQSRDILKEMRATSRYQEDIW
ncbi:NADPH-cytochrome P450 reductase, variant [Dactylonectria macrodidyma]|uniref:NADPH--cytochrome P450 reductase n=1 Tax=Dactylonectria macrodidyma TaxID=307937 RepID=A0A9P9EPE8_9HYPO|nr:NADPH-cytochrome P450 reductase, variant [Dactylonectria macrodidyma]